MTTRTSLFNYGAKTIISFTSVAKDIQTRNLYEIKPILDKWSINDLTAQADTFGNSLLHVATMSRNLPVVKYLLERGMNKEQFNDYKKSAWLMAIESHDQELLQTFIDYSIVSEHNKKVSSITTDHKKAVSVLESKNTALVTEYNTLKSRHLEHIASHNVLLVENSVTKSENTQLKLNNKRLREENDVLKLDVIELAAKSRKLEQYVKTKQNESRR